MMDPIEKMLGTPFKSLFDTDFTSGVMDILNWHDRRNARALFDTLPESVKLIAESLEHITVNPKNRFKTFMLSGGYVYAGVPNRLHEATIVNSDASAARDFVHRLVDVANNEWSLAQNRTVTSRGRTDRVIILTGEKGSGKTYFLNHVYSAYAGYLDKCDTVWVRVNLSRDRNFGDDLSHWYQAQASKILLRYYEKASLNGTANGQRRIDFIDPLRRWAAELPDQQRTTTIEKLERLIDSFCGHGTDNPVTPAVIPANIAERIFSIGRQQGLKFIIVFDGYDNLDCDRLSRSRFRNVSKNLRTLVSTPTRSGIAMLVVCRTETLAQVANAWSLSTDRGISAVRLEPSPFYDVVINRVDRLIEWLDLGEAGSQAPETNFEARTLCLDFKNHFIQRYDEGYYTELIALFPSNNRACVQMLSAEFAAFISDRRNVGGYRLIEMLTLAGFSYPPVIYDYFVSQEDVLICNYNPDEGVIPYDTRFLPVITRPPVPKKGRNIRPGRFFGPGSIFHGIRLLQFVKLVQQTGGGSDIGVTIACLKSSLFQLFGYHPVVTTMACYELEVYGCIKINREYHERNQSDDDEIVLMPKGNQILVSTLWDPAYLNLCSTRTIIPRELLKIDFFQISEPFNRAKGAERQRLVGNWAANKVSNSLGLLRMMYDTNEKQSARVLNVVDAFIEKSDDDLNINRFDILELFEQTRSGIQSAVGAIAQIYKSMTSDLSEIPFQPAYKDASREQIEGLILYWLEY